jgi:hypothetical protein
MSAVSGMPGSSRGLAVTRFADDRETYGATHESSRVHHSLC